MIGTALKLIALAYVGFGALLYLAQRELIYFPVSETTADGIPVEYVENDGERLKIWRLGARDAASAVLYFGGNAENVLFDGPVLSDALPGQAVYLVNYRGYAGSTGEPTEAALYDDALRLFDHVADRHAHVAVIGRSLGSAVAVHLASRRPVDRMVLVTPFDSLAAVARGFYPFYPVGWMIRDRFDSAAVAGDVRADSLLLLAGDDRITPTARADALADALANSRVERVTIAGAGHNTISGDGRYWQAIRRFLGSLP